MTYWRDNYGNEYHWLSTKDENGKFWGFIWNRRSHKKQYVYRVKKRLVKEFLERHYDRSQAQYRKGIASRKLSTEKRRIENPPKFNKKQLKYKKLADQVKRSQLSIKNHMRKIKLSNSWIKRHEKIIKQNTKKMENMKK